VNAEDKTMLRAAILHTADETRKIGYNPSGMIRQLASTEPDALIELYVANDRDQDGLIRLHELRRLDLSVENIAWQNRGLFHPAVGKAAAEKLRRFGFNVRTQRQEGS
jgi:hypothetical protein